MKLSRKPINGAFVAICTLAVGMSLSACAPSAVSPTSSSSPSTTREAQGLGTRMCVINNTSMNMRIFWRGYPDSRPIPPAGQHCNSGYESKKWVQDIAAKIEFEPVGYPGTWNSWELTGQNWGAVPQRRFGTPPMAN